MMLIIPLFPNNYYQITTVINRSFITRLSPAPLFFAYMTFESYMQSI